MRDAADPAFWSRALGEIDRAIAADPEAGETTAVATAVVQGTLVGASVGDSGGRLMPGRTPTLLGSGQAHPSGFGPHPFEGTLVTASDGLFDHATVAAIWGLLGPLPLADIAASLVALVRLPSGALADDVCVLVARPR